MYFLSFGAASERQIYGSDKGSTVNRQYVDQMLSISLVPYLMLSSNAAIAESIFVFAVILVNRLRAYSLVT